MHIPMTESLSLHGQGQSSGWLLWTNSLAISNRANNHWRMTHRGVENCSAQEVTWDGHRWMNDKVEICHTAQATVISIYTYITCGHLVPCKLMEGSHDSPISLVWTGF
jgi:hypothetical protein